MILISIKIERFFELYCLFSLRVSIDGFQVSEKELFDLFALGQGFDGGTRATHETRKIKRELTFLLRF